MSAVPIPAASPLTVEEYLALEQDAETKSEYLEGRILAMAGGNPEYGSPEHTRKETDRNARPFESGCGGKRLGDQVKRHTNDRKEQIAGGLVGLLVGDALGVPYEFHPPGEIPPLHQIEFEPPDGYDRAHWGVPPGTWSDDGAQALCLLASLLERGRFDPDDFGQRMVRWDTEGYMAVNGHVFDIGITTNIALSAIQDGTPPLQAGPRSENANGNGSLMRVLPLALWHRGTDAELVVDAHLQSQVTHGHRRSQVCCALYCLWARYTLNEAAEPWREAVQALREQYTHDEELTEELEEHVRPDDPAQGKGTGYVMDCLNSARWALKQGDYEQVVRSAVALGNDTDTTACVAGGIAGIKAGLEGIPDRWRARLRGQELLEPLMERLLAERG